MVYYAKVCTVCQLGSKWKNKHIYVWQNTDVHEYAAWMTESQRTFFICAKSYAI